MIFIRPYSDYSVRFSVGVKAVCEIVVLGTADGTFVVYKVMLTGSRQYLAFRDNKTAVSTVCACTCSRGSAGRCLTGIVYRYVHCYRKLLALGLTALAGAYAFTDVLTGGIYRDSPLTKLMDV